MTTAIGVLCMLTSLTLVGLVLLHKGSGGGLSDLLGGGAGGGVHGSATASRNLTRMTVATGFLWVSSVLALALLQA